MKKIIFVLIVAGIVLGISCKNDDIENAINVKHLELIFNLKTGFPDGYEVSKIYLGIAREVNGLVDDKTVQYFVNPKPGYNRLVLDGTAAGLLLDKPGVYFFLSISGKNKNGEEILLNSEFVEIETPLKIGTNRFEYLAE
jgi:hypothetical protein